MDTRPIGIFDSGVGALSVLKPILDILPKENFVYLGDNLRMPYGVRTPEEINQYTQECFAVLNEYGIKSAVIACNTSSSYGLDNVRKLYDFPILGVIEPGSRYAAKVTSNKKVVLFGTNATCNSGMYDRYLEKIDPEIKLLKIPSPDLVLAVENRHFEDDIGRDAVKKYVAQATDFDFDTIILGCTHFPLARQLFEEVIPKAIKIADPAISTAVQLKELLKQEDKLNDQGSNEIQFLVTGDPHMFRETASQVLNMNPDHLQVKKIVLQ